MILIFQFRDQRKRLSKEALNIEERCYGTVYRVKLKLVNRLMVSKGLYDIIISRCVLSVCVCVGRGGGGEYFIIIVIVI